MQVGEIAIKTLQDTKCVLYEITEQEYTRPESLLSNATIGHHTRHIIEFYQCLLEHIQTPAKVVDYTQRKRNRRLENDPAYAIGTIDHISGQLRKFTENLPCLVSISDHACSQREIKVRSNLERELLYNVEHTIHHMAIIKIGLKIIAPHIPLPDHFGIAPSTIEYRKACAQ